MPNWAYGRVSVSGTKKNIINFVNRFIFSDADDCHKTVDVHKCFYRSFIEGKQENVHKEINQCFKESADDLERIYIFPASFAWGAICCIIRENIQDFTKYIDLADACKEDQVSVEIETVEYGNAFEESIRCDKNGDCSYEAHNLLPCTCRICSGIEGTSSCTDLDDNKSPMCE